MVDQRSGALPPGTPGDPGDEPAAASGEYARLGRGGGHDQMGFRVVLGLLLRCLPLLRPVQRPLIALLAGTALLVALLFAPTMNLLLVFWNSVLESQPLTALQAWMLALPPAEFAEGEMLDADTRRALMQRVLVVGGIVAVIAAPAAGALFYGRVWLLQQINQHLRLAIFDRLQSLSLRFHAEQRVGDSIYRMTQDSAMVTMLIDVLFLNPLEAFTRFAFSLALVALWDPWLALTLLALWPGFLWLGFVSSQPMRGAFLRARESNSALTSRIQETLTGIRVIKAYSAEAREQARFEAASHEAFEQAAEARTRFAVFKVAVFVWLGLGMVAAFGYATHLAANGATLFGDTFFIALGFSAANAGRWDLGLFNSFKDRYGDGAGAVRKLSHVWAQMQDIATGLDRVFELLDLEPEIEDEPDALTLPPFRQEIRFRSVSFRYGRDRPVLSEVNLRAQAGSITAIVGPTGSGKSTLMSLLLRLYDPDRGAIEIDGLDLRRVSVRSLREQVAIALQENVLFGASVRENIRYALPHATDAQVREAARVACAAPFIETLANGYDTMLGERGTKLSTGQRQRLSIARAVLKDTPILILDEPTASLDAATELAVLTNLAEWGRGRAIFLITHRLSTIRRADRVAVIRDGRLVECGSHAELMEFDDGVYRGLIDAEEGRAAAAAGDAA